jgi:MtN3 and saliva related transmembrane protein
MQYATYILGVLAATLTSLSYLPQVRKAIPRGSTSDLSLKMLVALSTGLCLWVLYGFLKEDWVIMLANMVGDPRAHGARAQSSELVFMKSSNRK